MAHFVFVVPPFAGHTLPTISVGKRLIDFGHRVTWVGYSEPLKALLPGSLERCYLDGDDLNADIELLRSRFYGVRGFEGLKLLWEDALVPLARQMYPLLHEVVERLRPDVVISDQQTLAGAMVANSLGLKWATSATTPADRVVSLRPFPKILDWSERLIHDLFVEHGLEPGLVPEDSPDLVLSYYSRLFIGPDYNYPEQYRFTGPSTDKREEQDDFPWESLDDRPCVLVSLGSLNAERGRDFFQRVIEAFDDAFYQVVIIAPGSLMEFPQHFIVRPWVPMLKLLKKTDVLITHAGTNSVCEAIMECVPMVTIPILDAQPIVAQRVADTGCGVRLSFKRSKAGDIRNMVDQLANNADFNANLVEMKQSFTQAGGSMRAARLLEDLLENS